MNKILLYILILAAFVGHAQTQSDTLFSNKASEPVLIDGIANESCWEQAEWNAIDQVWIPFGADVPAEDFSGRFKVAWDEEYLYLLVEVVDDSLSDDYLNPLDNWWNDDCLEIFIDENRSKGDHECNNNAFAYHLSLYYDAVDLSPTCNGINYKEHVEVVMDTIADNTYLWEMAINIYNDSYTANSGDEHRVSLSANKPMGLTVAYCDSDEDINRENFIGSMEMTAATHNDMYKNADHFGLMMLVDPNGPEVGVEQAFSKKIKIFPNPASNFLSVQSGETSGEKQYFLYNSMGSLIMSGALTEKKVNIDLKNLDLGVYFIQVNMGANSYSQSFIKQ